MKYDITIADTDGNVIADFILSESAMNQTEAFIRNLLKLDASNGHEVGHDYL
jgi:hypothetical protein